MEADYLNKEIEIRFGTPTPVPFKDARTGMDLHFRAFGNATVVVKDSSKYASLDEVKKKGAMIAIDSFNKAVAELSGSLDASALERSLRDISKKTANGMNRDGLQATSVTILSINLDEESKNKIKAIASMPMTNDHPNPDIRPMTDDFTKKPDVNIAPVYPNFCTYCGAKAGSRFCPSCGAKLV